MHLFEAGTWNLWTVPPLQGNENPFCILGPNTLSMVREDHPPSRFIAQGQPVTFDQIIPARSSAFRLRSEMEQMFAQPIGSH